MRTFDSISLHEARHTSTERYIVPRRTHALLLLHPFTRFSVMFFRRSDRITIMALCNVYTYTSSPQPKPNHSRVFVFCLRACSFAFVVSRWKCVEFRTSQPKPKCVENSIEKYTQKNTNTYTNTHQHRRTRHIRTVLHATRGTKPESVAKWFFN